MHQAQTDRPRHQRQRHLLSAILLLLFLLSCSVVYPVAPLTPLLPARVPGYTLLLLHQHIRHQ